MTMESDARRNPPRPVVGVGAVVWRSDRFLLVRRGKEPNKGQWSLPGGAQRLGETVFAAAAREVAEETGLTVDVRGLIDVVDGIMRDGDGQLSYHYTLIDVTAESTAGEAHAGDDAIAVAWFSLEDLPTLGLWSETERVIRLSARQRAQSRGSD